MPRFNARSRMLWEPIGHAPLWCTQCAAFTDHRLDRVGYKRRFYSRKAPTLFGHERSCSACGLRLGATEEVVAIKQRGASDNPEADARSLLGEGHRDVEAADQHLDVISGLAPPARRYGSMVLGLERAGALAFMPVRPGTKGASAGRLSVPLSAGGFVAVGGLVALFAWTDLPSWIDANLPEWSSAVFGLVGLVVFVLCTAGLSRPSRQHGPAMRHVKSELAARAARALSHFSPTGQEVYLLHEYCVEHRLAAGMLDPERLFVEAQALAEEDREARAQVVLAEAGAPEFESAA